MVSIPALWLPIVVSSVVVFVASSLLHMVLTYHRRDYRPLPDEAAKLGGLRGTAPGYYVFPYCTTPKEMGTPEMQEKYKQGPVGLLTVLPSGAPTMGKHLVLWFVFCLIVGVFAAYLTGRAWGPGTEYLTIFRFAGTIAFIAYGIGEIPNSIWRGTPWGNTIRALFDGLIYSLLTAGIFGWLWPA